MATDVDEKKMITRARETRVVADSPFDIEDADVVFTTSDGVEFRVYKAILSVASPFFRDMFSLKQPTSGGVDPIPVTEDRKTFDALLRLCYPVDDPVFADLSSLEPVLEAAMKYQLSEAINLARRSLREFVALQPLHAFAVACRLQAESEAQLAASTWKARIPGMRLDEASAVFSKTIAGACFSPYMSDVSAACFYRLLYYCRTKPDPSIQFTRAGDPSYIRDRPKLSKVHSQDAWDRTCLNMQFGQDVADVLLESVDGDRLPAHSVLFRLGGARSILEVGVPHAVQDAPVKVLQVPFDSKTLTDLIRILLPSTSTSSTSITDPQRLCNLAQVATRYHTPSIAMFVRKEAAKLIPECSLTIYLLAAVHGWKDEASRAARTLADKAIDHVYDPFMEDVSASAYHALLQYHHQCRLAVSAAVRTGTGGINRERWKALSQESSSVWPISVLLPVVEKELQPFSNAAGGPCRGCGSGYGTHSLCGYNVSELVATSKGIVKDLEARLRKIKLELPAYVPIKQAPLSCI
ncbi:BTB domain-containing protein [Phanerochaete sordida]|uniref:BTB domain-containing protein n=1 Tax=Phanerochaete sordida TaxID=48140 RepID=A0A9P3GT91_9APHY|nr:BTB domain-containing protein [Phanerochaete sordida]